MPDAEVDPRPMRLAKRCDEKAEAAKETHAGCPIRVESLHGYFIVDVYR